MNTVPFWLAAVGGLLLAVASVTNLPTARIAGAALFIVGVILFFAVAVRRARTEGIGMMTSLGEGARGAIRFAWYLMPSDREQDLSQPVSLVGGGPLMPNGPLLT